MASAIGIIESKGIAALIAAADSILKNSNVKILGLHKLPTGLLSIAFSGDKEYVEHALEIGKETVYQIGELFSSSLIIEPEKTTLELLNKIYYKLDEEGSLISIQVKVPEDRSEKSKPLTSAGSKKKNSTINMVKVEKPAVVKEEPVNNINSDSNTDKKSEKEAKQSDPEISTSTIERLRKEALGLNKDAKQLSAGQQKDNTEKVNEIININELKKLNVHKLRKFARSLEDFPIKGRQISLANRNVLLEYFKNL